MPVVAVGCFGLTKKTLWLCLLTLGTKNTFFVMGEI